MLEASTFQDDDVISLSKNNFINLKIDAETTYGQPIFENFQGRGYPLIIFLDSKGNELDRLYGSFPAYEFIIKMNNVLDGKGTFSYYLDEYNKNNHSSEILASLAQKYQEKGELDNSLSIYQELLQTSNISKTHFEGAKYNIGILSINNNNLYPIKEFLTNYPEYENIEDAVYALLNYYKSNQMESEEINLYTQYLNQFKNSYSFLNSYAWRMTELNGNLKNALSAINKALKLIDKNTPQYPNILDTKAEILWMQNNNERAVNIINQAIELDSKSEYYKVQKNKFLNSILKIAKLEINNNNLNPIKKYLANYPESNNIEDAVYALINYYKTNQMEQEEINVYNQYLEQFNKSYSFLNSYAWRMTEINKNLDNALKKIDIVLDLINPKGLSYDRIRKRDYPNFLSTKAEVLWKQGKNEKALIIINQVVELEPNNQSYIEQKNKFINS